MARLIITDLRFCFDPSYYLDRYPDVGRSGIDPLAHYLWFGAREGRQPHPLFDVPYYIAANPDVAAAGVNPLLHFLRYGWKEGRRPNPTFDATFYIAHIGNSLPPNHNPFGDYVIRRQQGETPRASLPLTLPAKSYQIATTINSGSSQLVDILMPVYRGLHETRRCLDSVLSARCQIAYEIIVIHDQAPDPQLVRYLREGTDRWTLVENPENLGFAASVNRGFTLHPDRDVVLLNNDTEVAHDWLDRLARAASVDRTGTVTPFSNNATICSFPMPDGMTAGDLDTIFRRVNAGYQVEIPTAVGFCMYIRRDCLKEVGDFRAEVFGKGYGEENDFSRRATYKGWKNVLAADVFVYHAGETSFGSEAESRRKAGVEAVERLHPGYGQLIAAHIRRDPARPYRIAVSAERMRESTKPVILSITHNLGGGVKQYVRELRENLAGRAGMLLLTPTATGGVVLEADDFDAAFDVEADYEALVEVLRRCGVSRIHLQHPAGHTLDVRRLKHDLGVPLDFSVHDYFVICPQVTLTDAGGRYCGEPDEAGCNACLAGRPPWPHAVHQKWDIRAWREKYGLLVEAADRVIAPSRDAADRMRRYFPGANIVAAAHPGVRPAETRLQPELAAPHQPLVIAVLGAMTPQKGIHRLRAAASEAWRRKLPLRFVLAGYVDQPTGTEPFAQTGPYNNDELPGLLQTSGAHVVWFPALWPETFSYTLSVCLEMGLPVIAPDLGAFRERVDGRSWTWIVPWDWDIPRMLDFLVTVRRDHFVTGVPPTVPAGGGPAAAQGFYPVEYLR